ncbi:MAG: hypothetical protein P1U40_10155 [Coxiellaceae bacterium]|nr:hypothetical protein [Coxiellaceae bacterium]
MSRGGRKRVKTKTRTEALSEALAPAVVLSDLLLSKSPDIDDRRLLDFAEASSASFVSSSSYACSTNKVTVEDWISAEGEFSALKPVASGPAWDDVDDEDIVFMTHIREHLSPGGNMLMQTAYITVSNKEEFYDDSGVFVAAKLFEFNHNAPSDPTVDCLLVMRLELNFVDSVPSLKIIYLGLNTAYQGENVITDISVNVLKQFIAIYGDMVVKSEAVHPATALFFATTEAEREAIKELPLDAFTSQFNTSIGDKGRLHCRAGASELVAFHEARKQQKLKLMSAAPVAASAAVGVVAHGVFAAPIPAHAGSGGSQAAAAVPAPAATAAKPAV